MSLMAFVGIVVGAQAVPLFESLRGDKKEGNGFWGLFCQEAWQ